MIVKLFNKENGIEYYRTKHVTKEVADDIVLKCSPFIKDSVLGLSVSEDAINNELVILSESRTIIDLIDNILTSKPCDKVTPNCEPKPHHHYGKECHIRECDCKTNK